MLSVGLAVFIISAVSALAEDVVISKMGSDIRYQYLQDDNGALTLTDSWLTKISAENIPFYWPRRDNEFHLFTRANPTVSQPLLHGNENVFAASNFSPNRPTIILLHGYRGSATSNSNLVLVPAYLAAADVNVVIVDWSKGANASPILTPMYASLSSLNTAFFTLWLSNVSGQPLSEFTLVGFGLSGLKVGQIGRLLERRVGNIVALDPTFGPRLHELLPMVRHDDARHVEVVHTNVGNLGFIRPMGKVDFYPNGGINMAGCGRDDDCDHNRAFFYWAESLTSGGFIGVQCQDFEEALNQECTGPATLPMGGLGPKTGASGIYSLRTNPAPPFSL
ncbi:lipase member I [Amyelois transitella]|uniref:lipase member I n=1 Tax=Amyelois transitella TaxID=680683 RepID=UPI00067AE4B4|nr:lipase member I [Amyelois transitella]